MAPTPDRSPPVTCARFDPLPNSKRCQHYVGKGSCALASEFMCGEWIKRNATEAKGYHVDPTLDPDLARARIAAGEQTEREQVADEQASTETANSPEPDPLELDDETAPTRLADLTDPNAKLPGFERLDVKPTPYQTGTDSKSVAPPAPGPAPTVRRQRERRAPGEPDEPHRPAPIMAPPAEVVSPEHVNALTDRDVEVEIEAEAGFALTLVPRYTPANRLELTFRDAATLANMLSSFPGASVKSIKKPCPTPKTEPKPKPETPTARQP